jgi:tetratricopeptide (TPR) repeat protein
VIHKYVDLKEQEILYLRWIKIAAIIADQLAEGRLQGYLSKILLALGQMEAAQARAEKAMLLLEALDGEDTAVDLCVALDTLAICLSHQQKVLEAVEWIKRSTALKLDVLGETAEIAEKLFEVAGLISKTDDFAEAFPLYQQALGIRENVLGKKHVDVGVTLTNMAVIRKREGEIEDAWDLLERSMEILGNDKRADIVAKLLPGFASILH